ncbi:hypothetical protein PIB30_076549 [Stylosanthes scabra]|uniref:TF-B3 domain-containing protein n=1 Tax=Stylosanthes scabra TaxID=79078 RepID=A0ABU6UPT7_9FABA|nr:hypothetical protein [Stylosanthes scabra]
MARTEFSFTSWLEWDRHYSSSCGMKKLKEPLMNADNSTIDEKTERGRFVQNNQHDFNNAEFEVADILLNLNTYFLERVNLEVSNGTVNSNPSYVNTPTDQVRVFSNSIFKKTVNFGVSRIKKQTKKSVNQTTFELPQNFKNVISDMGGSRITLLIEKTLYKSDLDRQQNLDTVNAEITELTLVKWFMPKENGSVSTSYILRSNWMNVAEANILKKDDVVQVWSFRVQEKLCMAIVKL